MAETMLPLYGDLPREPKTEEPISWPLFGDDDELGTLNMMTRATVTAAAGAVLSGEVFPLNLPLDCPNPPLFRRRAIRRTELTLNSGTDDYYDSFFPQAASQWDGLAHVCHPDVGYYNGRSQDEISDPVNPRNGIEHWAKRGIVARYVLVDVARHFDSIGSGFSPRDSVPFAAGDIEATLSAQSSSIKRGDILLLRFGWLQWYESLTPAQRESLAESFHFPCPGLLPERATAEWLWNNGVMAVAADTPTLERMPFDKASFEGFLHYRIITMLGMPLGEMFALDKLAMACAADGRYTGMLTSAPLNYRGGAGSPANAVAIR
jgi:kynurenine formamidase